LAIQQAFDGSLVNSAFLVGIAAIFDFFDGFAARILGVSSPIGKDLDSLADMVTFGVVPGIIMFQMIKTGNMVQTNLADYQENGEINGAFEIYNPLNYVAFMIPVFSAIRLAKFNNDSRQSDSFIGLPTPANAIFISSFTLIDKFSEFKGSAYDNEPIMLLFNPTFLIVLSFVLSYLLVAPLPLFALKFKSFGWKGNEIRYVFLGLSIGLLLAFKFIGIPLIIILYILLSVINNIFFKTKSPMKGA
jgi:CDP-diacylglycerol--serine O-phosphatidyltransferase